ncbi:UNVERIFIED_CONTAM: hypothetical protein FKN15_002947 [Acipenser sinensis]
MIIEVLALLLSLYLVTVHSELTAFDLLAYSGYKYIMQHYGVPDFRTALEFLALLARRQGRLKKGGVPDHDKAAKSVLLDWTG